MKLPYHLLCAISLASLLSTAVPANDIRLDPGVAPTFQWIDLQIDADRPDYRGSVRIELEVKQSTDTFRFHAEGQIFERVELRDAEQTVEVEIERGEDGLVTATTERALAPGPHTLTIDFTHSFNTQAVGLYRMEQGEQGYLFTQFQAVDARKAFPCWDEPGFKQPFQLQLTVPQAHLAVSNTPVEAESTSDTGKTLRFKKTPPLPSYLLAIASGPLESVPIPDLSVPGRIYTVQGQSHLATVGASMTPPILEAMEAYFGSAYPYEKLDFIAIPEFWPGAMENPGAVTYADRVLLADEKEISVSSRRRMASVIAHELAHMWFGNLVTMNWWDDLWLNESFASWLGGKVTHDLFPEYDVDLTGRRSAQRVMSRDARPSTAAIRRPVTTTAGILTDVGLAYAKGETVLGMFETWLGEETFRAGVLDYIRSHAWGNAVAANLWDALSKSADRDVSGPLSSYLDQPGLPLISIEPAGDGMVTIRQRRFLHHGVEAPDQLWKLPIRIRYANATGTVSRSFLLTEPTTRLDLGGEPDWVLPDDGAFGYYRWSVPTAMLLEMAEDATELLAPAERIAFLGNAGGLLDSGAITGGDYLQVLGAFADDPEPEVISGVLSALDKVRGAFVPDELLESFADYVRHTLRPLLDRIGTDPRDGEDETVAILRPRLLRWLGEEGRDPEVRKHAARLARAYMKQPSSVDSSIAGTVLSLAAIEGDAELFEAYKKNFEEATNPGERGRYLSALGSFEDRALLDRALAFVLEGPLHANEMFSIPRGMGDSDRNGQRLFEWVTAHYEEVTSRIPPEFAGFLPFVAGGCSTDRLEAARVFFSEPDHRAPGTERTLARVADQVNDCVNLRSREGEAVASFLTAGQGG